MIYVIDDEICFSRPLELYLKREGQVVRYFESASEAYGALKNIDIGPDDAVLIDVMLPSGLLIEQQPDLFRSDDPYTGIRLAKHLLDADRQRFLDRLVIYTAAFGFPQEVREWLAENNIPIWHKSDNLSEIVERILDFTNNNKQI